MNKKILLFFLSILLANYICKAQLSLDWHGSIKGSGSDHVLAVGKDCNRNFYIASRITDTTQDIDPGPGVYNLTGQFLNPYISKHDSSGNVIMAFLINAIPFAIYADSSGFIYVLGEFTGCKDFDPDTGITQLCTGSGGTCVYFAKYTPNGGLDFVRKISTGPISANVKIRCASFNSSGKAIAAIACDDTLLIDTITIPVSTAPGGIDLQVIEFDSTGNSNFSSVIDATDNGDSFFVMNIKHDFDGNYLLTGYAYGQGTVIGNSTQNYTTIGDGGMIAKLTPTGECIFAKPFLSGQISDAAPLSDSRTAFLGTTNGFIYGVLDSLGNIIYTELLPGSGIQIGWMISDSFDNYYFNGAFTSVGPNLKTGLPSISAYKDTDNFIAKFDQNGKYSFFFPIEGDLSHTIWLNMFLLDQNHFMNISSFLGTCDFDLGFGVVPDSVDNLMDVGVSKYTIRDSPQTQSNYFRISGSVFHDVNLNAKRDSGEILIPGQIVEIQPGNSYAMTDANGFYIKYVSSGNYSITLPSFGPGSGFNGLCLPAMQTAVVSVQNSHDLNNNFGLHPSSNEVEMEVVITPVTPFESLTPSIIRTTAKNNFFTNGLNYLSLLFDSLLNVNSTSPLASSVSSSKIQWHPISISPYSNISFLTTFMDTAIFSPDSVTFYAVIDSLSNDFLPSNNFDTLQIPVSGSFDPNMKLVYPAGDITVDQISNGLVLDYTIHFQNTGTAPAWRVLILDSLPQELEISSLEIVDVSHSPCTISLEQENVLVFKFVGINLPDSASDELGSHGFVRYRIKPKSNLTVGSAVYNKSEIIFDFNPDIVTNTTSNFVVAPLSVGDFTENSISMVSPTITTRSLYLASGSFKIKYARLSIFSSEGKPIVVNKLIDTEESLLYEFDSEKAGPYFVTITTEQNIYRSCVILIK